MLGYVVGWLGGIICPTIPVPPHHIPRLPSRANMSYNFPNDVGVVVFLFALLELPIRTRLFITGLLVLVGLFIVTMAT